MVELLKINPADNGGAELPRNVEAEAALLGAIMIDNRIAEDVQLRLKAEHFFEPLHGRIYDAIMRLLDKDMVANPVTLKPMLEQDPALKELGGAAYLAQLTGNGAALIGADGLWSSVREQLVGDGLHVGQVLGVGADAAEDAKDELDEERRRN